VQGVDVGPDTITVHGSAHGKIWKVTLSVRMGSSQVVACCTRTLTLYVAATGKR
jgi:hypothetical protein